METINDMTPDVDKLVGGVLENGVLVQKKYPVLCFDESRLKKEHLKFALRCDIKEFVSTSDDSLPATQLFGFFYKVMVWSFLALPFMGQEDHEVVEIVWTALMVHDSWRRFVSDYDGDSMYLLVNYIVRGTVSKTRDDPGRRYFYLYMYREDIPNKLQSLVFKVWYYYVYNKLIRIKYCRIFADMLSYSRVDPFTSTHLEHPR